MSSLKLMGRRGRVRKRRGQVPNLKEAALPIEPKYFRSNQSKGYLETEVEGRDMTVRAFWDDDTDGASVVFVRVADYPDEYLYIAVNWGARTIISTAFASTDKQARRLLLDDLERRGWSFA
jgi:hypothetical protein